jgi:lipopolysaccharide/colanic/teichoic acid biosynthesis glycosyltransferase
MKLETKENILIEQAVSINKSLNKKSGYFLIKRIADIGLSLFVVLFSLPLTAILAVLVKLESKGPVFYTQTRVGKDGQLFKVYKLRTMYTNTENEGGGVRTLDHDPRITRIGNLIRKSSFDEFPQFFNILKGEMSYIGPRPLSLQEHNLLLDGLKNDNKPIPRGIFHKVKPGLTGWTLLHKREQITYKNRFKLNAEYEDNISLAFDLKIFYLTFKKYMFTNLCVIGLFLAALSTGVYFLIF